MLRHDVYGFLVGLGDSPQVCSPAAGPIGSAEPDSAMRISSALLSASRPVLAMAEASRAQYLVTGDEEDLLALGMIGGTHVVTARQFVEALEI